MRVQQCLLALVILLAGCRAERPPVAPSIEFVTVPDAAEGGPEVLSTIAGKVAGARPGQRIVVFAKSGLWWVQPFKLQPFTSIQPDATWKSQTHFGVEYAVLLVDASYQPPATMDALPPVGGPIAFVATTKGTANPKRAAKILQFSGYDWEVRQSVSERGGTINPHDPANAWVDDSGLLHLRIARRDSGWTSAEVRLTRSLGYGTYMMVVRDTSHLEPAAVFSMYTWDEAGADPNHRELDVEISRWGDPANKNAQFVIQPYHVPANVARFSAPAGVLTHSFRWEPDRVLFRTVKGARDGSSTRPLFEHAFTSGVPAAGAETLRLNLYVYVHTEHPLQTGGEVIVEKFVYLP